MDKIVCGNFYDKVFTEHDLDNILNCPTGIGNDGIYGIPESFDTTSFEDLIKTGLKDKEEELNSISDCFGKLETKTLELQEQANELSEYLNIRDKLIEYYDNIEGIMYYYLYRKFAFNVIPKILNISSDRSSLIQYIEDFNASIINLINTNLNFKFLLEFINTNENLLVGIKDNSKTQNELLSSLSFDTSAQNLSDILINNKDLFMGFILANMDTLNLKYNGYTTNVEITKQNIYDEISLSLNETKFFHSKINYYNFVVVKESPLLNDITFFTDIVSESYIIEDKSIDEDTQGVLYDNYYNLLTDLLNNFFTEEEKGITQNPDIIDTTYKTSTISGQTISRNDMASVKMSTSETAYYIKDQKTYETFFTKLQENLEPTLLQKKIERLSEYRIGLLNHIRTIALSEAGYFSINYYNSNSINTEFINLYDNEIKFLINLLSEIKRLSEKIEELKSELKSDKLLDTLKQDIPCFKNMDKFSEIEEQDGNGSDWKQFPTFNEETLTFENLLDPEAPTFEKHCYWLQFAKLATIYGLLPFPDLFPKNPAGLGLRYWPVGLKIPTPVKIINIPLPVIWIPIITISLPAIGTFVFFIGLCGIMPSPFLMYINQAGIKKFIVTLRGQSESLGYDPSVDQPKFRFNVPLSMWKANLDLDNPVEADDMDKFVKGQSFDEWKTSTINKMIDSINSWGSPDMTKFKEKKNNIKYNPKEKVELTESEKYQEQLNRYSNYVSELVDAAVDDLATYVGKLEFPKIKLIDDNGKMDNMQSSDQLIDFTKRYESYSMKEIPTQEFTLKEKLNKALNTTKFTPELQAYRFPETIDLENETHFNQVLDYMKVWTELSLRAIGANELFFSLLDIPQFQITSPLECKTIFELPQFNNISTQVLETFIKLVWAAIDAIDIVTAIDIIGVAKFGAIYLANSVVNILNALIPDFALPTSDFVATIKSAMLPTLKASLLNFVPEVKFNFPSRSSQIEIDTNIVRDGLVQLIKTMQASQDFFPFQIPTSPNPKNMGEYVKNLLDVNDIDFKMVVINIVKSQATRLLNMVKPIYDGVNGAMSLYNFKQSILDYIYLPQAMVKMAMKTLRQKGIENAIEIPSPLLLKLALELMKVIEYIPYPIVGAMAATGLTDLVRQLHPIMPSDDLPPWERLTLKNLLFVLFLDDFCHNGKMYGGFKENFLP